MTTITPTPEIVPARAGDTESLSWGEIAVRFANRLANPNLISRGDLADLRRMDPDAPDAAVVWQLLSRYEQLDNLDPVRESQWGLILHGIALMTPTAGRELHVASDSYRPSAHNPTLPIGQALYQGGDANRGEKGFYSESRLNRLLTAREGMFRALAARAFRMLGRAGQPFNWRDMANLILNEDKERGEEIRRRIARSYYQTQRRYSPAGDE